MEEALRLAELGAGAVSPNPMVGALIVRDGRILGRGYHQQFGGPHAEVNAIEDCIRCGNDPQGATMFATLEPCCHYGKTPPCTESIVRAGISHLEIATLDDCTLVAGRGMQYLAERGIEVNLGCCDEQSRRLNAGFFKLHNQGKPLVILKWAQSRDGRLAHPSGSDKHWITGPIAREHVHQLRSRCGAILVGIGTVLADDPMLNVRTATVSRQPLRVILDSHLRIPLTSKLVQTAKEQSVLICTFQQTVLAERDKTWELVDRGCEIASLPEKYGRIDLEAVLKDQLGKRQITDLLVEGGGSVLQAFWSESLVDKVFMYIAPIVIGGGEAVPAVEFAQNGQGLLEVSRKQLGNDLVLEGWLPNRP